MAFSEFETKRVNKAVAAYIEERRPPEYIRPELDLAYRLQGQSVEIFEVRPCFRGTDKVMENPVAKATYVKKHKTWQVYWQRADLKWHSYKPSPEVDSIEKFLALIDEDEYGCFFG